MKYKTTQKQIKSIHKNVIAIPYCDLQTLLRFQSPDAYTVRREGWAADIYEFGWNAIATGYAPFGNIHPRL